MMISFETNAGDSESKKERFVDKNSTRIKTAVTCHSNVVSGFNFEDSPEIEYQLAKEPFAYGRFAKVYRAIIYVDGGDDGMPVVAKIYKDKKAVQQSIYVYGEIKKRELDGLPLFYFADKNRDMVFTSDLGGEDGVTVSSMTLNKHHEAAKLKITEIKNFEHFVKKALDIAKKGREKAIFLPEDAYLLSFDKDGGVTGLKITIGDLFNQVKVFFPEYVGGEKKAEIDRYVSMNIGELRIVLESFISQYVVDLKQEEYLGILESIFPKRVLRKNLA